MNKRVESLTIEGVEYVPKDSLIKLAVDDYPIYMVRTYSAGVFYGGLKERNGKEVTLTNATRVFFWKGASTLSQLAQLGTSNPNECKFPMPVSEVILTEAIELIPVTEEALKTLNLVKIWKS
jgi:hypothetical protein